MFEPVTKATVAIFFTAVVGAIAKVIKDRKKHWRDVALSMVASGTMALLAYLIAEWREVGYAGTLVMVWAGSFIGKEGYDIIEETILTAMGIFKALITAYGKSKTKGD